MHTHLSWLHNALYMWPNRQMVLETNAKANMQNSFFYDENKGISFT